MYLLFEDFNERVQGVAARNLYFHYVDSEAECRWVVNTRSEPYGNQEVVMGDIECDRVVSISGDLEELTSNVVGVD